MPVGPRSEQRLHLMHGEVTRPKASRNMVELEKDLDKWESELEEYYRCGGERLGERTKVMTAKHFLPQNTDAAIWLAIKSCQTYSAFRTDLREATQYLFDHGAIHGPMRAHVVERSQQDSDGSEDSSPSGFARG